MNISGSDPRAPSFLPGKKAVGLCDVSAAGWLLVVEAGNRSPGPHLFVLVAGLRPSQIPVICRHQPKVVATPSLEVAAKEKRTR